MYEIERKFLLEDVSCLRNAEGVAIVQGYLFTGECVCRVRIADGRGYLVLKSVDEGIRRYEFEYEIPREHAQKILELYCGQRIIRKVRYEVAYGGHIWELDVFDGRHSGLKLAEVELESPDDELQLPPWVGKEVSEDPDYFNYNLARSGA